MAGESARDKAQRSRDQAARLLANAEKWERGADGEARTGEVLATLGPGWAVWHDLVWPGRQHANIDHLVIGPTGIFVVDSKNWSGSITIRDDVLRQNGYRREREVAGCDESAIAVGSLVPEFIAMCHPVLCFVRDEPMHESVRGVTVCSTQTLIATITGLPVVLDPTQIAHIAASLGAQMSSKPASTPAAPTQAARRPSPPRRTASRPAPRARRRRRSPVGALLRLVLGGLGMLIGLSVILAMIQGITETATPPAPAVPTDAQVQPVGQ